MGQTLSSVALSGLLTLGACAGTQQTTEQRLQCLRQGLHSSDLDRLEAAADDLGKIGPAAAPAVPQLAQVLTEKSAASAELRESVLTALGRIGPPAVAAVPAIIATAASFPALDALAEKALRQIGPQGEGAAIGVLRGHGDWRVRRQAARLLRDATVVGERALIAVLHVDKRAEVRRAVALALGARRSARALPAFRQSLRDPDWETAFAAARALAKLGARGQSTLREAFFSADPASSVVAAEVLERQPRDEQMLSVWLQALKDSRWPYRRAAVRAIARLGSATVTRVAPALQSLVADDPSSDVQQAAEEALAPIEGS